MIDGYVGAGPTEVPNVMHTKSVGVNTDAAAQVETLQTVAAKPPCIDRIRLHPIQLSKVRIGWLRNLIIKSCQIYDLLTTQQTLILWIITCEAGRG
ncbi:hypothetical protein ACTXT7_015854 [Hymenolepis weldensis]